MGLLDTLRITTQNGEEMGPEFEPQFEADPEPGEPPRRKAKTTSTRRTVRTVRRPTQTQMAKEVAEDLTTLIEMSATLWGMSDQCCAPILEQQAAPTAKALTAILARNPRLLERFAHADLVAYSLQTAALARALLPVGKAVYKNHISGAVDEGEAAQNGNGPVNLADFGAYRPR